MVSQSYSFLTYRSYVRSHYGTEFRIECVDATTDRPIGTGLITTQGLLQQQRDYLIEEKGVPFLSFIRPIRFTELRRISIELRAGLKSGFSSDFYSPTSKTVLSDSESRPGESSSGTLVFARNI